MEQQQAPMADIADRASTPTWNAFGDPWCGRRHGCHAGGFMSDLGVSILVMGDDSFSRLLLRHRLGNWAIPA
jgi:hypothetical protein